MNKLHRFAITIFAATMILNMTACSKKQTPTVAPNTNSTQSSMVDSHPDSSTISSINSSTATINSSATQSSSMAESSSTAATGSTQKAKSGGSADSTKSINSTTTPNNSKQLTSTPNTAPNPTPNPTAPSTKPSTPTQPSTKPSEPTQPSKPKTAYDRPFDTNQIRNDMIAYGQSKGMQLDTSLWVKSDYSSNCSYFPPTNTSQDIGNATEFIQDCKDSIDYTIAAVQAAEPSGKVSDIRFNIVLLPNSKSSGDYYVFVLYG